MKEQQARELTTYLNTLHMSGKIILCSKNGLSDLCIRVLTVNDIFNYTRSDLRIFATHDDNVSLLSITPENLLRFEGLNSGSEQHEILQYIKEKRKHVSNFSP